MIMKLIKNLDNEYNEIKDVTNEINEKLKESRNIKINKLNIALQEITELEKEIALLIDKCCNKKINNNYDIANEFIKISNKNRIFLNTIREMLIDLKE